MDDEGKIVRHVFEAGSVGYLAYDHLIKKERKRQEELQRQHDREFYTAHILLKNVLLLDFAQNPTGTGTGTLDESLIRLKIQVALTDNVPLRIAWTSELDDKLHTDEMWVDYVLTDSFVAYRKRTEAEVASFDRLRAREDRDAYKDEKKQSYESYVAERAEFHRKEAEEAAAKAARGPWYRRLFK